MSFLSLFSKKSIEDLCSHGEVHIEISVRGPDKEIIIPDPINGNRKTREPNIIWSAGMTIKSYEQLVSDYDNFKAYCQLAKHQDPLEKKRLT